jgi:alkylglycerol monooxygenase
MAVHARAGGTLIVWDRMFNTFAEEQEQEEVVFGLTHNTHTFDIVTTQTHHWQHMYRMMCTHASVWDKMGVVWRGPGWSPGQPRLGRIDDIPDTHPPHTPFTNNVPANVALYACLSIMSHIPLYISVFVYAHTLPRTLLYLVSVYMVAHLYGCMMVYDKNRHSRTYALCRCVLALCACAYMLLCHSNALSHVFRFVADKHTDTLTGVVCVLYALELLAVLHLRPCPKPAAHTQ